jgi:hypothetical protein
VVKAVGCRAPGFADARRTDPFGRHPGPFDHPLHCPEAIISIGENRELCRSYQGFGGSGPSGLSHEGTVSLHRVPDGSIHPPYTVHKRSFLAAKAAVFVYRIGVFSFAGARGRTPERRSICLGQRTGRISPPSTLSRSDHFYWRKSRIV